ncbi:hypothetical protein EV195_104164 [Tenacibaculum skagerrakense]|uniref:Uncharacterized protein n=1 Tax=Tenacibaculum skagerrakense TaxID=186571 RepID=A0A4R2NUA3_9FLAO|nr:hypothetical protein [Tenacibaculum skagerrakense]TCP25131.1 hypothetical protein EV195_104164 [Tenacibaculum skagerrakense]
MKLRNYKRILFFLNRLESFLESEKEAKTSVELTSYYTDSELREIIHWLYRDVWSKNALGFMERPQLLELINSNYGILLWTIHSLEKSMTDTPNITQSDVDTFFQRTQNELHYLASKPVEEWDEYDTSNYRSLLVKTGTTKKVFAIFTSDVLAEDVYAVTTKPSYFFDTKAEAEEEIDNILIEGKFTRDELVVHSLWLLT